MMMPVPSAENPWTIGGAVVIVIAFFTALLRLVGPWRKQITEAEERLRKELMANLEAERNAHAAAARQFALERDEMGDRIAALERIIKRREKVREAERSLERHKFNNLQSCFDALLLLLKANPDRVPEAVKMIEEMRANQIVAEAEEKAIIHAAEIGAAQGDSE